MQKHRCSVCGCVYDESIGDAGKDIAAGTTFGELPDDYCCSTCGAGKWAFEEER